jgi:hypothetical protein
MTIINSKDLDAQMGRSVDPASVPTHNATGEGYMQPIVQRGSEQVSTEQGNGRRGAAVYGADEVGGQNFFGSKTIISVNDAPPLQAEHDPKLAQAAKLAAVAPPMPAPTPAPIAAAPQRPKTAQELIMLMGLGKKP